MAASQRYTAFSHLVGAVLLLVAWLVPPDTSGGVGGGRAFSTLWVVMFLYALTYMPTIATTNAIAFKHMRSSERFGSIRVWGTLGWIFIQFVVGGYLKGLATKDPTASHAGDCLLIGAIVAVLMGLYSFSLPDTPPVRQAKNPYAFLEAFELTRNRNFMLLLVVSFVVAIELPWYYNLTPIFFQQAPTPQVAGDAWLKQAQEAAGKAGIAAPDQASLEVTDDRPGLGGLGLDEGGTQLATTIGQIAEISMMCLLAFMLTRAGMRWTVFLGILAWPLRYLAFSIGQPTWLVLASQALHGIAFTFFFAAGMVAAERLAPKDIRNSAQSLMVFATSGCGMLVGHFLSGKIHDLNAVRVLGPWPAEGKELLGAQFLHNWPGVFLLPIIVTTIAAVVFVALFNEKQYQEDVRAIAAAEQPGQETQADG
ncbi:MAG: MFS transporter [Armatimonadetes bacterium]|nr:MFS transporter [Armatimonadota bacterium]